MFENPIVVSRTQKVHLFDKPNNGTHIIQEFVLLAIPCGHQDVVNEGLKAHWRIDLYYAVGNTFANSNAKASTCLGSPQPVGLILLGMEQKVVSQPL